jgi:uncharacterized membrane protein YdbT with pleckstrin-like domain
VAFPPKLLNEGEEIVLDLHPHWWFFAGPVLAVVVTLVGAAAISVLNLPDWLWYGVTALLAVNLLWLLARLAKWVTTNFVVTTDRLIYRSGVLAKQGKEIPLERLNDISFNQGIFERMLGAGDLLIESGGERGQQAFTDIKRPAFVQNEIYRQIEENQRRSLGGVAPKAELSVPEQLEKLDDLRRRGVLTQAEFDAKKAQLLDRM